MAARLRAFKPFGGRLRRAFEYALGDRISAAVRPSRWQDSIHVNGICRFPNCAKFADRRNSAARGISTRGPVLPESIGGELAEDPGRHSP